MSNLCEKDSNIFAFLVHWPYVSAWIPFSPKNVGSREERVYKQEEAEP